MSGFIIDPYKLVSASAPLLLVYKDIDQQGASTTYTFSSKAIKDTYDDRHLIVAQGHDSGTGRNVSTLTVDGVSATSLLTGLTNNIVNAEIWIATLTSANGATGDIVVTMNGALGSCNIAWAVIEGLSSTTPIDTASVDGSGAGDLDLSCNTQNPSVGFGVTMNNINTDENTNWTAGLTENAEIQNSTNLSKFSVASGNFTSASTPLTITAASTSWNVKRGRCVTLA